MSEALPKRQCGCCYFCRDLAGTLHCVRNPPQLDRETGAARWPRVRATDICGGFRCCDGCPLESDCWPRHDLPIYTDRYGDYCKIPLTKGLFAKVDPEDYIWLSQFRWHCKVNKDAVYAVRTIQVKGRSQRIYMHRLLMNTPPGMVCDHINHDGLDDRKGNLRNCTIAQNNANRRSAAGASSKYIGVARDKRRNKWVAHIKINGEEKYLGSYDVEEDAARAHDAAAWAQHGVYASLNFPQDYPDHPSNRFVGRASPPAKEPPSTAEDAEGRRGREPRTHRAQRRQDAERAKENQIAESNGDSSAPIINHKSPIRTPRRARRESSTCHCERSAAILNPETADER